MLRKPHVAALELVFIILLEQDRADQACDAVLVGEDADDIGPALHLLVQAFERIGAVQLDPVLFGEGHIGEHVVLGGIHAGAQLGPAAAQLIRDMTPGLGRGGMVGLQEDLTDTWCGQIRCPSCHMAPDNRRDGSRLLVRPVDQRTIMPDRRNTDV
jgi:hypothetical protein